MKVFMKISFIMAAVFAVSFNYAYAQESKSRSNDSWFLAGYSYTFPDSGAMEGLQGPATITIGGDLWRFIGLEITLGGRWDTQNYTSSSNMGGINIPYEATNILWSFDMKPYLILQPKLGVDMISLRPYFGIGPSFHFTGINSTEEFLGKSSKDSASSFDVGVSVKAGLRLQAIKFLFVGVGTEYLYHQAKLNNKTYNFSGWTVGAEVGFIW